MTSVRSQLVGAWDLVTFTATAVDDPNDIVYPLSESATGMILYTPDGYMSAQLQRPESNSGHEKRQEVNKAATDEISKYDDDYSGYGGQFHLVEKDGEEPILTHHMRISSFKDWLGATQRRIARFETKDGEKYLIVSPEGPMKLHGRMRNFQIRWRRAADNGPK